MTSIPPGADFYASVFATSTREQQASFLKSLFIKDTSLRYSYQSYISPPYFPIYTLLSDIEKRYPPIQKRIKKYDWSLCYDVDPQPDDYLDVITETLERKIIGDIILNVSASLRIGLLPEAIANMRVIEKALYLDWEALPEPASHTEDISGHFAKITQVIFMTDFNDHIFAPSMIENALELISGIIMEGSDHRDNEEVWASMDSLLRNELRQI